jgi:hypothetical protein
MAPRTDLPITIALAMCQAIDDAPYAVAVMPTPLRRIETTNVPGASRPAATSTATAAPWKAATAMGDRTQTLEEVAEKYRLSERSLREFIRKHSIPVFHTGKQIRFDGLAIVALEEALRRCPSKSQNAKTDPARRSPEPLPYRTGDRSAFESALSLTAASSPKRKPPPSRRKSSATPGTENVVALDPSRKRSKVT